MLVRDANTANVVGPSGRLLRETAPLSRSSRVFCSTGRTAGWLARRRVEAEVKVIQFYLVFSHAA